jgi:glycerate-2-kinase
MRSGATINELNAVRKQLSQIKGGKLARACRAGRMVTLVISDVIGDPLDVIASGPTVEDSSTPAEALAILDRYAVDRKDVPHAVWEYLGNDARRSEKESSCGTAKNAQPTLTHYVIGNNAVALEAARQCAKELGYRVHSLGSNNQGEASTVGRALAELALSIRDSGRPVTPPACVLSGGEPVVHLAPSRSPRKGGRNQELVLAALARLWDNGLERIVVLSGGTDGEDGPTDAAGAIADADVWCFARGQGLSPGEFLATNNSYPFFESTNGLLKTGPTHTNVMDLRVVLVGG